MTRTRRTPVGATLLILAGTVSLAPSASFIKLAGVDPVTTTFLRCGLALLVLAPLAGWELVARGRVPRRLVTAAVAAGALLGIDYLLFNASVLLVGAAIATVLVNAQVVMFPVLAKVFGGVPIPRRVMVATPVMLLGVALVGGVLDSGVLDSGVLRGGLAGGGLAGGHTVGVLLGLGSALAYSGYLYLSRTDTRHVVTPVCLSTAAAASVAGMLGLSGPLGTGLALTQSAPAWGWLAGVALCGQVLPWLLISAGGRRLAPASTAALLLSQVVFALVAARILVHERPSPAQLVGAALVITAVLASALSWPRPSRRFGARTRVDLPRVTEVTPAPADPRGDLHAEPS
jgi:drug/metabolite transporter (DMT)-like permease